VTFRSRLTGLTGRTATFADGSTAEIDAVVWATEYRTDYSWLHVPGVIVDGAVRHDAGATDVPGLYFLGLPWQTCRGSALLGFVGADAATVSDRMAADAVGQPQPIGAPRMSARLASPPPATRPRTPGAKAIPAASVVDANTAARRRHAATS
jgi:putative flavoprotein involved in K+ transport